MLNGFNKCYTHSYCTEAACIELNCLDLSKKSSAISDHFSSGRYTAASVSEHKITKNMVSLPPHLDSHTSQGVVPTSPEKIQRGVC